MLVNNFPMEDNIWFHMTQAVKTKAHIHFNISAHEQQESVFVTDITVISASLSTYTL